MNKYYYDLHIHSCLSPCGDNDMTPANIAGMAAVKGLQIAALTATSYDEALEFADRAQCRASVYIDSKKIRLFELELQKIVSNLKQGARIAVIVTFDRFPHQNHRRAHNRDRNKRSDKHSDNSGDRNMYADKLSAKNNRNHGRINDQYPCKYSMLYEKPSYTIVFHHTTSFVSIIAH